MKSKIFTVFKKETIDNLRDGRSLSTTIFSALFTPLLLVIVIIMMGKMLNQDTIETPLELPVIGAENAPNFIEYLKQQGVIILPGPENPEEMVKNGDLELVLVIPEDYGEAFTASRPAPVQLIMDSSRLTNSSTLRRTSSLLDSYSGMTGNLRLIARGIDPSIRYGLLVESVDMATPQSQSLLFLNMLPFFLIMSIYMGGMYVIIDTTAGERDRGSLEPLLTNPVRRRDFVLGKLLASLPFALGTLIISLVALYIGFNVVPLEEIIGMPMTIQGITLWNLFLLCLPMLFLASGLQMILATYTRSFKEAQTYLSFVPLIAGAPGLFLTFIPAKSTVINMLIPNLSQSLLINQVMRGEAIDPNNVLISTVSTLILGILSVILAMRLFQRESVLFGKK